MREVRETSGSDSIDNSIYFPVAQIGPISDHRLEGLNDRFEYAPDIHLNYWTGRKSPESGH